MQSVFHVIMMYDFCCCPTSLQVPLKDGTVDIAVFCLSLMGTNLGDFLFEANRVLVMG